MSMGAAAAEAEKLVRQQEEQEMTPYTEQDLAGDWEFKIIRTYAAGFRKPEVLRSVLEEEKRGGWILVEKFDDSRIRLKRPAGDKMIEADFADGYDPYRTMVGTLDNQRALLIVVGSGAFFSALIVMMWLMTSR